MLTPEDSSAARPISSSTTKAAASPTCPPTIAPVPSKLLRAGVIQVPDASGKYQPYNLNPTPVTVDGVTYQPAHVRRQRSAIRAASA